MHIWTVWLVVYNVIYSLHRYYFKYAIFCRRWFMQCWSFFLFFFLAFNVCSGNFFQGSRMCPKVTLLGILLFCFDGCCDMLVTRHMLWLVLRLDDFPVVNLHSRLLQYMLEDTAGLFYYVPPSLEGDLHSWNYECCRLYVCCTEHNFFVLWTWNNAGSRRTSDNSQICYTGTEYNCRKCDYSTTSALKLKEHVSQEHGTYFRLW